MCWTLELRGGSFDGWGGTSEDTPEPVLIVWHCGECSGCEGHATFDMTCPAIILARAQAYSLVEADEQTRVAVYEVGDVEPGEEIEADECVLAGASMARIADREADALGPFRGMAYAVGPSLMLWALGALSFVLGVHGSGL